MWSRQGDSPAQVVGETRGCDSGVQQKSRHYSTWTLLGLSCQQVCLCATMKRYLGSQLCGGFPCSPACGSTRVRAPVRASPFPRNLPHGRAWVRLSPEAAPLPLVSKALPLGRGQAARTEAGEADELRRASWGERALWPARSLPSGVSLPRGWVKAPGLPGWAVALGWLRRWGIADGPAAGELPQRECFLRGVGSPRGRALAPADVQRCVPRGVPSRSCWTFAAGRIYGWRCSVLSRAGGSHFSVWTLFMCLFTLRFLLGWE